MTPSIATHALTRTYGSHAALSGVTLTVEPGSVYALVGPNGAGKSTLIQLLMNLQSATSGSSEILGLPSHRLRGAALNRIGYISESQELPDWMTVGAFLRYLRPFYPTWDLALERQLLDDFALPLDRKLKHLSRGMRMKAAFVGTLAYRPALMVLDEPFSGLDPLVRDELIQGLLDRIGETTLFLSSHDLADIESFASHVGYLEQGHLLFSEDMTTLSARFRLVEFTAESTENSVILSAAKNPRISPTAELHNTSLADATLPTTWLEPAHAGSLVRFTHSAFTTPQEATAQILALYPTASDITFEPLSLRNIFLANARNQRTVRTRTPKPVAPAQSAHGVIV